jgi:molybdopterin-containing oxidoreductase family membrane subunit
MDFATSVIPGWHTTIFPPYFVAGAIFSGFAMVLTLLLIVRKVLNLEEYITRKHVEYMNIVIVITGSMVGVAYLSELFIAWYSGVEYEGYAFLNRATGPYSWSYYWMMSCNVITPQLFWFKKIRRSLVISFILSIVVNIGMWFERFVIIVTSLHRDYIPSSWDDFHPTFVDLGIFIGTIGIFFVLFLLYSRVFPVLALNELKTIVKSSGEGYKNGSLTVELPTLPSGGGQSAPVEKVKQDSIVEKDDSEKSQSSIRAKIVEDRPTAESTTKDDLTKVEGIGPKINEILNNGGIFSFKQLSETDPSKLKELLVAAGPKFQMHKPASWPEQAGLAADGKWDELKVLQDNLSGGKE